MGFSKLAILFFAISTLSFNIFAYTEEEAFKDIEDSVKEAEAILSKFKPLEAKWDVSHEQMYVEYKQSADKAVKKLKKANKLLTKKRSKLKNKKIEVFGKKVKVRKVKSKVAKAVRYWLDDFKKYVDTNKTKKSKVAKAKAKDKAFMFGDNYFPRDTKIDILVKGEWLKGKMGYYQKNLSRFVVYVQYKNYTRKEFISNKDHIQLHKSKTGSKENKPEKVVKITKEEQARNIAAYKAAKDEKQKSCQKERSKSDCRRSYSSCKWSGNQCNAN